MKFYIINKRLKWILAIPFILCTEYTFANNLQYIEKSNILGESNFARTKDAHIADINNDGWPDIFDGNSTTFSGDQGRQANPSPVIRFNNQNGGFDARIVNSSANVTTYDVDLVDINRDGLPDLIRTESRGIEGNLVPNQISVYRNEGGTNGVWFNLNRPSFSAQLNACPDDIDYGDLNGDGLLDFAIAERLGPCPLRNITTSITSVFLGTSSNFGFRRLAQSLPAAANQSTHDVLFIDADGDDNLDILSINEGAALSRLWLNNGATTPTFILDSQFDGGITAAKADFNRDGFVDFVIGGQNTVTVYLNNNGAPGQFSPSSLIDANHNGNFYDLELGDLDLDGHVDIVGPSFFGNVALWLNDGSGAFSYIENSSGTPVVPVESSLQILSADLIDYDGDGDLDLYLAGGDGGGDCFGCMPNQFFENSLRNPGEISTATFIFVPQYGFSPIPAGK
jgi:hypothetical protein